MKGTLISDGTLIVGEHALIEGQVKGATMCSFQGASTASCRPT